MKICQATLNLWSGLQNCWHTKAITLKVAKPELRFMCSACRLMVFNICVKFHENMSSGFKVTEQTRKLLTDTHTHREKRKLHTPMAYFVCRGYNKEHSVVTKTMMCRVTDVWAVIGNFILRKWHCNLSTKTTKYAISLSHDFSLALSLSILLCGWAELW